MRSDDQQAEDRNCRGDLDLNKLLTSHELELYQQHMEVQAPDGDVVTSAEQKARQILHMLVTEKGIGNATGGVHLSRSTVLPLLIDALVGPEPDVDAWIEALGNGKFDVSRYAGFRNSDAKKGTPGTLLPRLLQRYERALGKRGPVAAKQAHDVGTALRLLIMGMLIRELQKATTARAAMGSAWPLMRATRLPKDRELRRLLTHFGADDDFLGHLRDSIEFAVREWATHKGVTRPRSTNKVTDTGPPADVDVRGYFDEMEKVDKRREDALVAFGKTVLGAPEDNDAVSERALRRLAKETSSFADVQQPVGTATSPLPSYLLTQPTSMPKYDVERHHQHLRFLMPMLAEPMTSQSVFGCAVAAVRLAQDGLDDTMTGISLADVALYRVGRGIYCYARDVGPPPREAPLAHIDLFQASACYLSLAPNWPARNAWERVGFELQPPQPDLFKLLTDMAGHLRTGSELNLFADIDYILF